MNKEMCKPPITKTPIANQFMTEHHRAIEIDAPSKPYNPKTECPNPFFEVYHFHPLKLDSPFYHPTCKPSLEKFIEYDPSLPRDKFLQFEHKRKQ